MKWVILVIVAVLIPYTWVTLHYRKPGPAYRPYQDAQERANVVRLLSAGYKRITLAAERPADATHIALAAPTTSGGGGLPAALTSTLVQQPLLPAEILAVTAAPSADTQKPYTIQFTCTLPDNKQQLAGANLYVKDFEIVVAPDFELLTGGLVTRTRDNVILLTLPAGSLPVGTYHVTLVGQHSSRAWTLQVH